MCQVTGSEIPKTLSYTELQQIFFFRTHQKLGMKTRIEIAEISFLISVAAIAVFFRDET
jgi:hypothetical protein